jgi:hypothetical protein
MRMLVGSYFALQCRYFALQYHVAAVRLLHAARACMRCTARNCLFELPAA